MVKDEVYDRIDDSQWTALQSLIKFKDEQNKIDLTLIEDTALCDFLKGNKLEKVVLREIQAKQEAANVPLEDGDHTDPAILNLEEQGSGDEKLNNKDNKDPLVLQPEDADGVVSNEVPAAGAAEVNEVEEATASDINKEDASANVVVLQEFTHAAADLKDEASGSTASKSKVHATGSIVNNEDKQLL